MATSDPIFVVEVGESTQTVPFQENMTLGALISARNVNKNVTVKVNGERVSNDYALKPGDQVQMMPNVEAGL
jgi:sulfur carrier protein ThiS